MNERWTKVTEYYYSVKLSDEAGNVVSIPKNEMIEVILELLEINNSIKEKDSVH